MNKDYDLKDIAGSLRDTIVSHVYAAQNGNTDSIAGTRQLVAKLAVELLMGPDPHSGGKPHPDTVECLADGLLARIDVSNARPAAYADEPWRKQTATTHGIHARDHAITAEMASIDMGSDPIRARRQWISDLGQPEIAHAAFRCDMMLWKHNKSQ
jgi:hypothetical protein